LRRSAFAETVLDPIERALDVSPPFRAYERELFGAGLVQPRGLHA
jgi:hypothetical protein